MAVLRVQVDGFLNGRPVKVRNVAGRFAYTGGAGSQSGFADRNRQLALAAQQSIIDELKGNLERPAVSSGRLVKVTGERENVSWDRTGFAVGNEGFLDGSLAKYWRTIDEGTAHWKKPFVGSFWYVYRPAAFGGSLAGLRAGGPFTRAGASSGGKFNPISRIKGRAIEEAALEGDRGAQAFGRVYIKRDIQPKHYYREGFRKSGVVEKGVRSYWVGFAHIFNGEAP